MRGGFGFFDTLTYNEDNLPHYGNIPCFDRQHINAFFKRLRDRIETICGSRYCGYVIDKYSKKLIKIKNLDYFLVSEFGGEKARPHYHVIFFVNNPMINRWKLKRMIRECWTYGFVDPIGMLDKHVLTSTAAIRYICKYVSKIQDWSEAYNDAIIKQAFNNPDLDSEKGLRRVKPFVLASNQLGLSYFVDTVDAENGTFRLPDKNGVVTDVPISKYYKYKLYYILTKKDDKYRFVINHLGIRYKYNRLLDVIENTCIRYRNLYFNCDAYDKERISELLGHRTLYDVAVYFNVFRDCHRGPLPEELTLTDESLMSHGLVTKDVRKWYFDSRFPRYTYPNPLISEDGEIKRTARSRMACHIINHTFLAVQGFDEIIDILRAFETSEKMKKQQAESQSADIKKQFKKLY